MTAVAADTIVQREIQERTGSLDLGNCGLVEVPRVVWGEMPWLIQLNLSHNYVDPLTDEWVFSQNGGLPNNIERLPGGIPNLPELRILVVCGWVENYDLYDLEPISHLTKLEHLDCGGTDIRRLDALAGLKNLTSLNCSFSSVEDLEPLRHLKNLRFLSIHDTPVAHLDPLAELPGLERLDCSNTRITDLEPVRFLMEKLLLFEGEKAEWAKKGLKIEGLQLRNPPREVADKGLAAMVDCFKYGK